MCESIPNVRDYVCVFRPVCVSRCVHNHREMSRDSRRGNGVKSFAFRIQISLINFPRCFIGKKKGKKISLICESRMVRGSEEELVPSAVWTRWFLCAFLSRCVVLKARTFSVHSCAKCIRVKFDKNFVGYLRRKVFILVLKKRYSSFLKKKEEDFVRR